MTERVCISNKTSGAGQHNNLSQFETTGYGENQSNIAAILRNAQILPKLKIGNPDDEYEKEADSVAESVMRMPKNNDDIQTAPLGSDASKTGTGIIKSAGQPLDDVTRTFFESRFGEDFSGVRIHTDSNSADAAESINAKAFTSGSDIVFNNDEYSPDSYSGKSLIAHELAHVIQQNATGVSNIQRAVKFKADFKNINLSQTCNASIAGTRFNYSDADFSADAEVEVVGGTEAEINQWDVGVLQDMTVNWEREYWRRNNSDGKGKYVQQIFKPVNKRYRDQADGATTVWSDDSEHTLLSGVAKTAKGNQFVAKTTINTTDLPGGNDDISGSNVTGMDASDGVRNIRTQVIGTRFDTYISARNTSTGVWRHLRRLNWNYQRNLGFKGSGATLAVGQESGKIGRHGPYSAGKKVPLTSGTTANTAVGDNANWIRRRGKSW